MNKIVFVNRFFYPDHSATSQLLSDLAFALAGDVREIHVVTGRQAYDDPYAALPAEELCRGVHIHRVWATRFGRGRLAGRAMDYLTFYLSATLCLFRLTRRGDVIVAKTDPPVISVPCAWVAALRRARLINWLQDLFPEVAVALRAPGARLVAPVVSWLRNRSLFKARTNVVLGECMRDRVRAAGVPDGNIAIIPNWSNGDGVTPIAPENNDLRSEWALAGHYVVGYSGNMGRAHEFDTLVDVMEALRDDDRVKFLFIGRGARRSDIEREVARRGLTNVMFRDYQPRELLAQSLSLPDLHVISLRPELEGLIVPSKFYGVAAAGRPTLFIGDRAGELARILHAGQCGLTCRPGDVSAAVAAIRQLVDQPELGVAMGRRARALFEREYVDTRAFARWRAVLQGAVEDG